MSVKTKAKDNNLSHRVVGWNADSVRLQQMSFNLEVESGGQGAEKIVGGRP